MVLDVGGRATEDPAGHGFHTVHEGELPVHTHVRLQGQFLVLAPCRLTLEQRSGKGEGPTLNDKVNA